MRIRSLLYVLALVVLASGGPAAGKGGLVALNTCDASCPDDSGHRFVDCGNGTVTDNLTGLVWLANANCVGQLSWNEAMALVAGLGDLSPQACAGMSADECDCGLSDHSSPGEWRLPSMAEWKSMISAGWGSDSCAPAISNDVGNGCWEQGCFESSTCSFYGVQSAGYWSSSSYVAEAAGAWLGHLELAQMDMEDKDDDCYVWPVRGGQ